MAEFIRHMLWRYTIWTPLLGWEPSIKALCASFLSGISILVLGIQCSIVIESNSRFKPFLLILRTALAIPAVIVYLDVALPPHITVSRHFETVPVTVGLYWAFKTWEVCLAPLIDGARLPNWVSLYSVKNFLSNSAPHDTQKENSVHQSKGAIISPSSSPFIYSLDFLTTLRGVSWLSDRRFDFLEPVFVQEQARTPLRRRAFIVDRLIHLFVVYIVCDICDTLDKSVRWKTMNDLVNGVPASKRNTITPLDSTFANQLTIKPIYNQAVFVLTTGIMTQLALESFYTPFAILCVALFNLSPTAFPHFFSTPFSLHTHSVKSFWGERWHHIFRRVYDRLVDPSMHVIQVSKRSMLGKLYRVVVTFSISAAFHCIIQYRVQVFHFPPGFTPPLFDKSTTFFFLSQPLAIIFEQTLLHKVFARLPEPISWTAWRMWTWGWLFWSARWWTDCWIKMGMWQPEEQVIFFSVIRGLWRGEWLVVAH